MLAVDRCLRSVDCRAALPCSEPTRVTPWADPSCATGRPAPLAVDRRALSAWPPCAVSRPSPPWVDPSDPFGRPALGHRSTGTGDRRPISGFYYSSRPAPLSGRPTPAFSTRLDLCLTYLLWFSSRIMFYCFIARYCTFLIVPMLKFKFY